MKNIKKLGKIALTALTGATLVGGAAANLGDYPHPFVSDNGQMQSTLVVGQNAKTVDVVGAINIAGSLGQNAYKKETKTVDVKGDFGWSSSGTTLDTRNDQLYFLDNLDSVRNTLTGDQLDALKDYTFTDDNSDETDINYYLNIGSQPTTFDQAQDNEDPSVNLKVPSDVDQSSNLYTLDANFEDTIDFTSDAVKGQEIDLFGKTYTVGQDSFGNKDGLQLYGSDQEISLETGKSDTFTVNGKEHTVEVVAVTSDKTTVFRLDGTLKEKDEYQSFNVDGQQVRVTDVIQTNTQSSKGLVTFGIGSEEIVLQDGQPVQDENGDDIDGTNVELEGSDVANGKLSSISIAVGAPDSNQDFLEAGGTFKDPLFPVELHFGGLNPDAKQSDSSTSIEVSSSGDDTAKISFTPDSGSSTSVSFAHHNSGSYMDLADSDGNKIVMVEGDAVKEDEYFVSDAGDFTQMWRVSNVDTDAATSATGDQATVDLKEVTSSGSVEVDLDAAEDVSGYTESGDDQYAGTEVIDGQTYHFVLDTAGTSQNTDDKLYATWGDSAGFSNTGSSTTAFPSLKTENGGRLAFYDASQDPAGYGVSLYDFITGASSNSNPEMFVDDGTTGGSYQDGDDILSISRGRDNSNAIALGGKTLNAFGANLKFVDSSTTYDDTEAIVNSADGNLNSGEVVTDGSNSILTALSGTNYQHYDGDDTNGNADQYDGDGSGGYLEPIYDNQGTGAGTVQSGDMRKTQVQVVSTSDSDAGTIDLNLGTTPAQVASGDADASTGFALSTFSSGAWKYVDTDGGGSYTPSSNNDYLVYDVDTSDGASTVTSGDIVFPNSGTPQSSGPYIATSSGATLAGTVTVHGIDFDHSGSVTAGAYDAGDHMVLDLGTDQTTGGNAFDAVDYDLTAGAYGPAGNFQGNLSNAAPTYWDTDESGSYSTGDSFYINQDTTADSLINAKDVRVVSFGTATYSSGSSVSSGADKGTTIVNFGSDEHWLDNSPTGVYDNGEAIVRDTTTADANLEATDSVVVSGPASFQSLSSKGPGTSQSSSGWMYVDDSSEPSSPSAGSYQDGDDILSVTKTTSGGVSLGGTTLNNFASTTTHTGSSGYVDGNAIVDESGGSVSNEYDSGDSVLTGSIGSGGSVQYWSTDSEETNAVSGLRSKLPDNNPAVVFIEDKSNSDTQYSYVVEPEWNSGDSETQIKQPVFTDSSKRKTDSLDSNSDVTAGYDVYGTYSEYDSDGQHSVSLMYPNGQSTVGAAFTSSGGTLSKSGSSGSIETKTPTGFPDSAKLDSEVSPEGKNLILVGGPSVNTLVKTLAENGDTWKASDYSQNKALLDYVSEAFDSAGDALVVAGYSGKDTRTAANYIADYAQHKEELAGKSQKVLNTQ